MGKDSIFFPLLLSENQVTMHWERATRGILWGFLSLTLYTVSLQCWYFSISLQYCLPCRGKVTSYTDQILSCVCASSCCDLFVRCLLSLMNSLNTSFSLVPPTQLLLAFSLTSVAKYNMHLKKYNVLQFLLQNACI